MSRRLGSLAVALVSSVAVIVEPAAAAPPVETPIEGPAPPPPSEEPPSEEPPSEEAPSEEPPSPPIGEVPPPSITPGLGEAGEIEFATPPPEEPSASYTPPSVGQEIGRAPDSGAAFLAGGLWVIPISGVLTWVILDNNRAAPNPGATAPGIITTGVGLGLIGGALLGIGVARRVNLHRWAKRHRVIELPQGSGFTTSGSLAMAFGLAALIGSRTQLDSIVGGVMLATGPIQLAIGIPLAVRYRRTGGFRRTQYTLTPGGLVLRF